MKGDPLSRLSEDERTRTRKKEMPDWVQPMLARLTGDYFSDRDWIFERKLDGERVMAYIGPRGDVRLMSRNRKLINDSYPEIERALANQAPSECILDGEVVAFNKDNVSDFQRLQPQMHATSREESRESGVAVYFYLFDCLYVDGHDITGCSLRGRKKILRSGIEWDDPLRYTPHRNEDGLEFYREACSKGWEGLIAKRADSEYVHGRSGAWLKFKCTAQQEFVIGGFTEPSGERIGFGALLVGFYRGDALVYAGKVGTGFDDEALETLRRRLGRLERKTSPYGAGEPDEKDVHFVTPKLVCEVAFTEWTEDGRLRHPRFKGLRRDKEARDVHKETGA